MAEMASRLDNKEGILGLTVAGGEEDSERDSLGEVERESDSSERGAFPRSECAVFESRWTMYSSIKLLVFPPNGVDDLRL